MCDMQYDTVDHSNQNFSVGPIQHNSGQTSSPTNHHKCQDPTKWCLLCLYEGATQATPPPDNNKTLNRPILVSSSDNSINAKAVGETMGSGDKHLLDQVSMLPSHSSNEGLTNEYLMKDLHEPLTTGGHHRDSIPAEPKEVEEIRDQITKMKAEMNMTLNGILNAMDKMRATNVEAWDRLALLVNYDFPNASQRFEEARKGSMKAFEKLERGVIDIWLEVKD
ncbi:hypothetical protein PSHT_08039 [Puccinia striiformis]|uniref:Uncharacterized protein n=1 Tax=Puccinia striiformis TaxID=27350 RepID=A0A2S4VSL3_9BASI|nr:hypothetical protein PSHT_08039 [Puccinia striiformis]